MRSSAILLLSCFAILVVAQMPAVNLYQKDGSDDLCGPVAFHDCLSCTANNVTTYQVCKEIADDDEVSVSCELYYDAACTQPRYSQYIYAHPCEAVQPCGITYGPQSFFQFTVSSPNNLTIVADDLVTVSLSATDMVASGFFRTISFASQSGSHFSMETVFDDGTYLTTAGHCAFGAQCTAGDITYMAEEVAPVAPPNYDVHLTWYRKIGISSWSSSTSEVTLFDDYLGVNSADINDLVLSFKDGSYLLEVADMELENLDTDRPILYYVTLINGKASSYDFIYCNWVYASSDSLEYYEYGYEYTPTELKCSLSNVESQITVDSSMYSPFGAFEEAVLPEPNLLQKIANFF